jgi:hypothetical protein
MATTRSPMLILGVMVIAAFFPLIILWTVTTNLRSLLYFIGFALYFLIAHIALPGWVYLDANGRESDAALTWTITAFILPVIGFVCYYMLGQPDAPHRVETNGTDASVKR